MLAQAIKSARPLKEIGGRCEGIARSPNQRMCEKSCDHPDIRFGHRNAEIPGAANDGPPRTTTAGSTRPLNREYHLCAHQHFT